MLRPSALAAVRCLQLCDSMTKYFMQHAKERAGDGLEILPGVKELLQSLKQHQNAVSCLVTGACAFKRNREVAPKCCVLPDRKCALFEESQSSAQTMS